MAPEQRISLQVQLCLRVHCGRGQHMLWECLLLLPDEEVPCAGQDVANTELSNERVSDQLAASSNEASAAFAAAEDPSVAAARRDSHAEAGSSGGSTQYAAFSFRRFMIDKSATEICAIGTLLGREWLLCLSHMLQDWERFLRSSESGVRQRCDRLEIQRALKRLFHARNKQQFAADSADFKVAFAAFPSVINHYSKNWEPIAPHWAEFGRLAVESIGCNTNNYLERFFGLFKHMFCQSKRQQRLVDLVKKIVEDVIPFYIRDRLKKASGLLREKHHAAKERHNYNVRVLLEGGMIEVRAFCLHACHAPENSAAIAAPPAHHRPAKNAGLVACMQVTRTKILTLRRWWTRQ